MLCYTGKPRQSGINNWELFARHINGDRRTWRNLAQIAAVAHEYGVYYVAHQSGEAANDYLIDHSTYLYVMDPQGQFVQAFDADTPADRIADDLLHLVKLEERPH